MSQLALAFLVLSSLPGLPVVASAAVPQAAPAKPAVPVYVPPGAPTTPPSEDAAAVELAAKVSAFLKCEEGKKDPLAHFCALTKLSKNPIWTPAVPTSYPGLSVLLKAGGDAKKTLSEAAALAVLHLGPASAKLVNLGVPSTPDATATAAMVQKMLAGETKERPAWPASLKDVWSQQVHVGRVPLKLDRLYASIESVPPTRLFRTETPFGAAFVTVEQVADGQRLSVFPLLGGQK